MSATEQKPDKTRFDPWSLLASIRRNGTVIATLTRRDTIPASTPTSSKEDMANLTTLPSGDPPKYCDKRSRESKVDRVEREWEGPALNVMTDYPNLLIYYGPESAAALSWGQGLRRRLRRRAPKQEKWFAVMFVWVNNLPRLMREGFHWTPEDVIPGQGSLAHSKPVDGGRYTWKYTATYAVREQPDGPGLGAAARARAGEPPLWSGLLCICADDHSSLVDVHRIQDRLITQVEARNHISELVYFASRSNDKLTNMVYPGMRPEGAWAWPRKSKKRLSSLLAWAPFTKTRRELEGN